MECDEQHEPELFWALRGAGGGRFGIVTSFTFRTVPAPEATAFDLRFTRRGRARGGVAGVGARRARTSSPPAW